ncbi:hypothetical protein LLT3_14360 [Lactococcus cremoris subsp. cremoris TIFN3]|uniref:Uncharacterized protein n=1 Tax=Lactococcus cremoris subsp. cremoris TIFN3 TaxID=1234873 RepID=T0VB85_LACLC|nr:hypothetical protein LLT3_14360 [Lactococcus cremoris subsp. cremoris TIFN3]
MISDHNELLGVLLDLTSKMYKIFKNIKDSNILKMVQDTLLDSFSCWSSQLYNFPSWESDLVKSK